MFGALNKIRRTIALATQGDTTGIRRASMLSVMANDVLAAEVSADITGVTNVPAIIRHLAGVVMAVEKVAMFYGYSIPELIELAAEDL